MRFHRKLILISMVMILVLSLTACGSGASTQTERPSRVLSVMNVQTDDLNSISQKTFGYMYDQYGRLLFQVITDGINESVYSITEYQNGKKIDYIQNSSSYSVLRYEKDMDGYILRAGTFNYGFNQYSDQETYTYNRDKSTVTTEYRTMSLDKDGRTLHSEVNDGNYSMEENFQYDQEGNLITAKVTVNGVVGLDVSYINTYNNDGTLSSVITTYNQTGMTKSKSVYQYLYTDLDASYYNDPWIGLWMQDQNDQNYDGYFVAISRVNDRFCIGQVAAESVGAIQAGNYVLFAVESGEVYDSADGQSLELSADREYVATLSNGKLIVRIDGEVCTFNRQ